MSKLYLIHIEPAFRHAQHYLGYTGKESVEQRLERHLKGDGANMLRHAVAAGCALTVVRTWPKGSRSEERRLKGRSLRPLCPVCKERDGQRDP